MAGTIPLSMTQQFDVFGEPLSGGQLFIIQAGTVATPQNPYQDAGLSLVMPNPIILDAAGRIPQFFLADGYIKIRLTDVNGIVQLAADGILVIGPSAGGGGGGGVDPTTLYATGDMKFRYDNAVINGYVRANGRTIGSAASSATELADPSAQALFNYLWNKDTTLTIFPSRGASSAADWSANRQLTLPDFRGYALSGLDDMGNTAAGRLTAAGFGTSAIVLGAVGGIETQTLTASQIPTITTSNPPAAVTVTSTHNIPTTSGSISTAPTVSTGTLQAPISTNPDWAAVSTFTGSAAATSGTSSNTGGLAHPNLGPRKLVTFYLKL